MNSLKNELIGEAGSIYIDISATSTPTTWERLHRQLGKFYICKLTTFVRNSASTTSTNPTWTPCLKKTTSTTNQDLPRDSSSHPKARGLLTGEYPTGYANKKERSQQVAEGLTECANSLEGVKPMWTP